MIKQMIIANPAGNITAFVLDPVERSCYADVARRIFHMKEYAVEQVGFVTGETSMEMSGLEFCGNATRSFGLLAAKRQGLTSHGTLAVSVSGASAPLEVEYDTDSNYAKVSIEVPLWITSLGEFRRAYGLDAPCYDWLGDGTVVAYEGIVHAVVQDRADENEYFGRMKELIGQVLDPPAMGVMFCDEGSMTPIVYVKDVDSIYHEGSCGSGSTAYAAAYSVNKADGVYGYEISQPAGTILATCVISEGAIRELSIESEVEFSDVIEFEYTR